MTVSPPLFDIQSVTKRFGRQLALRSVDFQLFSSECVALLGANGAGKTTLMRILATLSQPTRGSYYAFGQPASQSRREIRARIGVVGHTPYIYPELTCQENLAFFAQMYGLDEADLIGNSLEWVGLGDRSDRAAATLSRGLLQRLDLARATLHRPAVLILDEPDTGLDTAGRRVLRSIIEQQIQRGGAVLFTSHTIEYALRVAERIVVLQRGDIVLDSPSIGLSLDTVEEAIAPIELVA